MWSYETIVSSNSHKDSYRSVFAMHMDSVEIGTRISIVDIENTFMCNSRLICQ